MTANRLTVLAHGPLDVVGDIEIQDERGETVARAERLVLCRCGHSADPSRCDGSHRPATFQEAGRVRAGPSRAVPPAPPTGRLVLRPVPGGPWIVSGSFDLVGTQGCLAFRDGRAALCRCGRSGQGPLCDGAHTRPDS